jgi:hypothetical protein
VALYSKIELKGGNLDDALQDGTAKSSNSGILNRWSLAHVVKKQNLYAAIVEADVV